MNVKIADLMIEHVITGAPYNTLDEVRAIMEKKNVHCIPIINGKEGVVGIITTSDLTKGFEGETRVEDVMTKRVFCVPAYNNVHIAARIMRNHHIHHVVVQHEKKVVGVISSFDLLQLVEKHRYISKNPPTESRWSNLRQ